VTIGGTLQLKKSFLSLLWLLAYILSFSFYKSHIRPKLSYTYSWRLRDTTKLSKQNNSIVPYSVFLLRKLNKTFQKAQRFRFNSPEPPHQRSIAKKLKFCLAIWRDSPQSPPGWMNNLLTRMMSSLERALDSSKSPPGWIPLDDPNYRKPPYPGWMPLHDPDYLWNVKQGFYGKELQEAEREGHKIRLRLLRDNPDIPFQSLLDVPENQALLKELEEEEANK